MTLPVRAVGMLDSRSKDAANGAKTHINGFAEHTYTGNKLYNMLTFSRINRNGLRKNVNFSAAI